MPDIEELIKNYTKEISEHPNDAAAYLNRGKAYQQKQKFEEAIKDYTQAISLSPGNIEIYKARAQVYYINHEFRNAINDFTEVIRLNPEFAEAYFYRGMAKIKIYDIDNGSMDLKTANELGYGSE